MTFTTFLLCYWAIVTISYLHFFYTYLNPTTKIILIMGQTDRYKKAFEESGMQDVRLRLIAYAFLYVAFLVFPIIIYYHFRALSNLEDRAKKAAFSYLEKLVAKS